MAADPKEGQKLDTWTNVVGVTGAPYDAWLTLRGLRTLFPRIERQQRTAGTIAEYLERHARVRAVHYPGLASHPGHAIAASQQQGFGAMLSFELEGGVEAVRRFVGAIGTFTLAESLGGVESLIAHPATMTHADMGVDARQIAGIGDALLRLSIGLEHVEDLIAGLDKGFGACEPDPVPLCLYEERARREKRQWAARASASVASSEQLPAADDLERGGVDIPDRLAGGEDEAPRTGVAALAGLRFSLTNMTILQDGDRGTVVSLATIASALLFHWRMTYAALGAKRPSMSTRFANMSSSV